jgi:hypothetical protein
MHKYSSYCFRDPKLIQKQTFSVHITNAPFQVPDACIFLSIAYYALLAVHVLVTLW